MKFPETVHISTVDDELVLLDSASGKYFALNATGTRMVELLQSGDSTEDCVRILTDEYDAPAETIKEDLEKLITELRNHGLVVSE